MGYVTIPLNGTEAGKDAWYPLDNRPGKENKKKKARGDIHVYIRLIKYNPLAKVRLLFLITLVQEGMLVEASC